MGHMLNLMGMRFGSWVALHPVPPAAPGRNIRWLCRCDCGTEKLVEVGALRAGRSTSCGCRRGDWLETDMGKEIAEAVASAMREVGIVTRHKKLMSLPEMAPSSFNSYSGIRGIELTPEGTWRARIDFKGKTYNFGVYKTIDEAVTALQEGKKRYIYPKIKMCIRDFNKIKVESRKKLREKLDTIYRKYQQKPKQKPKCKEKLDGE